MWITENLQCEVSMGESKVQERSDARLRKRHAKERHKAIKAQRREKMELALDEQYAATAAAATVDPPPVLVDEVVVIDPETEHGENVPGSTCSVM